MAITVGRGLGKTFTIVFVIKGLKDYQYWHKTSKMLKIAKRFDAQYTFQMALNIQISRGVVKLRRGVGVL